MNTDLVYFNGVNGATGNYLVKPRPVAEVAANARKEPPRTEEEARLLQRVADMLQRPYLALPFDVDPRDLVQAGWGVVFAAGDSELPKALAALIAHRQGRVATDRCKVLDYRPGEGVRAWLQRYGSAPGSVKPNKVPYYLLLAGDPAAIPFEFQYLLEIEYAVGRLAFDRPEQYQQYAQSVIDYEKSAAVPNAREVVFWATRHGARDATQMSADFLATPLFEGEQADGEEPVAKVLSYRSRLFKGKDATKANLLDCLHGAGARGPALLFTASHGLAWPPAHQQQKAAQGALLCQDYPGFGLPPQPQDYLAAADVGDDARVHGLVAFLFACFGAGTPEFNTFLYEGDQDQNFLFDNSKRPERIADRPCLSPLPQRLLSHPQGGALAVIGHTERAWGYSIRPLDANFKPVATVGPQLVPFRNCLGRILAGEPVGHSTKDISQKYALLAAELLTKLDKGGAGTPVADADLAWTWVERNDAQNYVVLGDPAVAVRRDLLQ